MRSSSVLGTPSSRRLPAARALVVGLLTAGLAALSAGPAAALASTGGDGYWGDYWDGGSARTGGREYSWPDGTRDYVGDVCPGMDSARTNTTGDPTTVELVAPEGSLISAYCLKSGSDRSGEGPKVVELEEPVASLTVAYPVDGRCKGISHYAVAYVDSADVVAAPDAETAVPTEAELPAETTLDVVTTDAPVEQAVPTAAALEEALPALTAEEAPAEVPLPVTGAEAAAVSTAVENEAPARTTRSTPSATPSAAPSPDASPLIEVDDATLTSSLVSAAEDGAARSAQLNTAAVGRLPFTGAQLTMILLAAVVLTAAGSVAVVVTHRRRASTPL